VIIELILSFFVEIVFGKIILNFFGFVHLLGLYIYKMLTLSGKSIPELKLRLKDSSKPIFLGWAAVITLMVLIVKWIWM